MSMVDHRKVDSDGEEDEAPECRICFERDSGLVSPCSCSGSMKYVHQTCLERTRTSGLTTFYQCQICLDEFTLTYQSLFGKVFSFILEEILSFIIILVIPVCLWFEYLSVFLHFVLLVFLYVWITVLIDEKWSKVSAGKRLRFEKYFHVFLTYLFIIEVECGFILLVEEFLRESSKPFIAKN